MGCQSSKPDRKIDGTEAVRLEETNRLVADLRSLGVASGPPPPSLILDESGLHPASLAVACAPELKEAISKNPGLHSFVNDHLNCVIIKTLGCLAGFRGHLDKARDISSAVGAALECFEKENGVRRNDKKEKNKKKRRTKSTDKYSEVVDKLKESRAAAGDPFAGPNTDELRAVCALQRSLLAALRRTKHELEKRLTSVKKWRRAWNVIYMAGFVAVLDCSVVLAALASPATAVTGAAASATALKAVGPWINSVWDEREGALQGEKDVVAAMQRKGGFWVHELENVRSIVEKLKIDIDAVLDGVDFVIRGEEDGEEMAVEIGIENIIMAKKGDADRGVDTLKNKLDSFEGEIRRAATEFLEIIMKDI